MVQHQFQPLAGDIPCRLAVDGVAENHVIRRYGLGNSAGGPTGMTELSCNLLTGPDFRKRSILRFVEVHGASLLCRREEFVACVHDHRDRAKCLLASFVEADRTQSGPAAIPGMRLMSLSGSKANFLLSVTGFANGGPVDSRKGLLLQTST